jgi:aspartate 1-decarboxylase
MTPQEAKEHKPNVVFVDEENQVLQVAQYEKHGELRVAEKKVAH